MPNQLLHFSDTKTQSVSVKLKSVPPYNTCVKIFGDFETLAKADKAHYNSHSKRSKYRNHSTNAPIVVTT
jgi:hypothetical protein